MRLCAPVRVCVNAGSVYRVRERQFATLSTAFFYKPVTTYGRVLYCTSLSANILKTNPWESLPFSALKHKLRPRLCKRCRVLQTADFNAYNNNRLPIVADDTFALASSYARPPSTWRHDYYHVVQAVRARRWQHSCNVTCRRQGFGFGLWWTLNEDCTLYITLFFKEKKLRSTVFYYLGNI